MNVLVGTAGWTVPRQHLDLFSEMPDQNKPSHLQRYASRFSCVEVNSSFHRSHRRGTWERWSATTPPHFRFAVKAPKAITHTARLVNVGQALLTFFDEVSGLGAKLGPVLFQLPPKLAFDEGAAHEFLTTLRELHSGMAVLEPRHASWFTPPAQALLQDFDVARAAADPPSGSALAAYPAGWKGLRYWRLHGTPHTYYSNYDQPWLEDFLQKISSGEVRPTPPEVWVIFDNTALGHAASNALWLKNALNRG